MIDRLIDELEYSTSSFSSEDQPVFKIKKYVYEYVKNQDLQDLYIQDLEFLEKLIIYINFNIFVQIDEEQMKRLAKIFGDVIIGLSMYARNNLFYNNIETFLIENVKKISLNLEG